MRFNNISVDVPLSPDGLLGDDEKYLVRLSKYSEECMGAVEVGVDIAEILEKYYGDRVHVKCTVEVASPGE